MVHDPIQVVVKRGRSFWARFHSYSCSSCFLGGEGSGNVFSQVEIGERETDWGVELVSPPSLIRETLEVDDENVGEAHDGELFCGFTAGLAVRAVPGVVTGEDLGFGKFAETVVECEGAALVDWDRQREVHEGAVSGGSDATGEAGEAAAELALQPVDGHRVILVGVALPFAL